MTAAEILTAARWPLPASGAAASAHPAGAWSAAARRIQLHGGSGTRLDAISAGEWRVVDEVFLRVDGELVTGASWTLTPEDASRRLDRDPGGGVERIAAALELPLAWWEVAPQGSAAVELSFRIGLGVPGRSVGSASLSEDDRRVTVEAGDTGRRVVLLLEGLAARLIPAPAAGEVGVVLSGEGRGRLVIIAAEDEEDLARTLTQARRRGIDGLARRRAQHARLLREYGVGRDTADAARDLAFEWAKVEADGRLAVLLASGAPGAEAAALAEALLAAGLRDGARRLLRDAGGGRPSLEPSALVHLARAWARWVGEPAGAQPAGESGALATVDLAASDAAEVRAGTASVLIAAIEGEWGVEPDAVRGAVTVRPRLPVGDGRGALRRLRIGTTALDLELRRRGSRVRLVVSRVTGPPLTVTAGLQATVTAVAIDEIALGGQQARFAASAVHEVVFEVMPDPAGATSAPERY